MMAMVMMMMMMMMMVVVMMMMMVMVMVMDACGICSHLYIISPLPTNLYMFNVSTLADLQ